MMNSDSDTPKLPPSASSTRDGIEAVPRVEIDWYRSIPWWRLLSQSVGISWRASHLILAAFSIWLTVLGWNLGLLAFAPEGIHTIPFSTVFKEAPSAIDRIRNWYEWSAVSNLAKDPLTLRSAAFYAFGVLWTIGVWSFAGGLLARRSLMEMGVRSSVGWGPTCSLVGRRWLSMVWGISMPLVAIFGLMLFPLALGFTARMGTVGQGIAIGLMIPSVILALGIGWCAAISAFGFPLSICAIVAEKNADAFDGVSRSAAYVFQRPMTIMTMLILAISLGWLGDFVVNSVLNWGQQVLWSAFAIGLGGEIRDQIHPENVFLHELLRIAQSMIPALRAAFLCSFFWSASAAAYLTLRWEIDHTDFDNLDLQELGEPIAVPAFTKDSKDVAEVVEPKA